MVFDHRPGRPERRLADDASESAWAIPSQVSPTQNRPALLAPQPCISCGALLNEYVLEHVYSCRPFLTNFKQRSCLTFFKKNPDVRLMLMNRQALRIMTHATACEAGQLHEGEAFYRWKALVEASPPSTSPPQSSVQYSMMPDPAFNPPGTHVPD